MNEQIKVDFGNRLKDLRVSHHFTQKQIADYLNITLRAYQYYEVGERFPSIETIIALSNKYKISFLEVLYDNTCLVNETITFNRNEDLILYKALSEKATALGLTLEDIISYVMLNYAFNN